MGKHEALHAAPLRLLAVPLLPLFTPAPLSCARLARGRAAWLPRLTGLRGVAMGSTVVAVAVAALAAVAWAWGAAPIDVDPAVVVAAAVVDAMAGLKLKYPVVGPGKRKELAAARKRLDAE